VRINFGLEAFSFFFPKMQTCMFFEIIGLEIVGISDEK